MSQYDDLCRMREASYAAKTASLITIMMVALALAACTPEQDLAQCEVESIRLYPNDPPKLSTDPPSRYIIACMTAKGYEFIAPRPGGCSVWPPSNLDASNALLPECYKVTGWRAWFTPKK